MKLFDIVWVLVLFMSALADEELLVYDGNLDSNNTTERNPNFNESDVKCAREHMYDKMDIREVLGKWKVVELYMHLSKEGISRYNSCPIITIWLEDKFRSTTFGPSTEYQFFHVQHINAKFHQENRQLRLLWDEAGQTIEYSLYFKNSTAGYWHVFDGQNGTLPALPRYQQFGGTIQVLKAVHDHLVLNFCQEAKNGRPAQLYSVLFSREPGLMSQWEINSIHSMLQTKKLSVASRRMVCGSSAHKTFYISMATIILYIISVFISS